jgi:phenylalanyl-tRNA synthetase beta chain
LQKRMLVSRRTLAGRGFNEAVTYAFQPEAQAKLFGGGQSELKLANAISSELTDMRSSLLPNLLAAAARNQARGFSDFAISEIGHAYAGDKPQDETLRAAGIRQGDATTRGWLKGERKVDAFDAKADVLAVLEGCGMAASTLQVVAQAPAWFHPGRSGTIQMGPQNKLAFFGEIHPKILREMDVKGPVAAFEVILNAIPAPKQKGTAKPALVLADLMSVERDFAFIVEDKVQAAELIKAAKGVDKALIADALVFDVFKLDGGKTSLAVSVTLQPREKTMTDEEIDATSAKIVAAVGKATGAVLRT